MKKQNIAFLNISTRSAYIAPFIKRKIKEYSVAKNKPFVVVNTDFNYGPYVQQLVKLTKQLGLVQQEKIFRQKSIKSIKYGEFIVFGDSPLYVDFDYRVETDKQVFANFDARKKWKVYDITNDFNKVVKRLEEYAKANNNREEYICKKPVRTTVNIRIAEKKPSSIPITCCGCPLVNTTLDRGIDGIRTYDYDRVTRGRNIVDYPPTDEFTIEDVAIHYRWVKVGYRQFDILYDNSKRRYVNIDGVRYYIRKNRFGKEYLTK